jgi:chromosome segregation ATPase
MTEDRRTLADVEKERDRASKLFDQVAAERNQLVRRVNELESTLRDVTGGDYDLGYSPADTITELREELAAAKAQRDEARKERSAYMEASREWTSSCLDARKERDAAVKRTEEAEAEKKSAADSDYKKRISLTRQIMDLELRWGASNKRLTELTTWRKGAPSEPGWYATRGPNLLAADNWDGVTWLNSHPSESTDYLPIRLDWCAEPAPASPYADEHKPEDTEDA